MNSTSNLEVRSVREADFENIIALCRKVYPNSVAWSPEQLSSHLRIFPEGQFVAIDRGGGGVVGYAASLIVFWDEYEMTESWRDFTDSGMFTNHDPERGRTLYGAEIMVDPDCRGRGVGKAIYRVREDLVRRLGLLRIRAGARLRDYGRHSGRYSPEEYVLAVVRGETRDRTLTFQLGRGFKVIGVTGGYLRQDPESLGYAAIIEWLNPEVATEENYANQRKSRFYA